MVALVVFVKPHLGFNLVDKVAEWFWDGTPEAFQGTYAFTHGHNKAAGLPLDSHVHSLELMAIMPGLLFHLSTEALLARLDSKSSRSSGSPCTLYLIDGVWHARWHGSFQHVMPGFSTFLNNSVESSWRVAGLVNGDSKRDVTNNMFTNGQRACVVWMNHKKLERIEFMPCGLLSH